MYLSIKSIFVLAMVFSLTACDRPIETAENETYVFADAVPRAEQNLEIRMSIMVTATVMAPEAIMFEGGSWFTQRKMAHSAILLCHPDGLLMFDTGLGRDIDAQFEAMPRYLKPLFTYEVTTPAVEQLVQEEFCPGRPLQIMISHLHWDHASGIEDFPGIPVWAQQSELKSGRALENSSGYLANQFDDPDIIWRPFQFTKMPYANYERSYDFFDDGSVVLVPMAGHTEGSVGMFVKLGGGENYFFTGDITWSAEGFSRPAHKHALMRAIVDANVVGVEQEVSRVHALMQHDPNLHVVPAHDYQAYNLDAIYPDFISGK